MLKVRRFGAERITSGNSRTSGFRKCHSSLVESLVGEVNARVKSKQKYWTRGAGSESILQLQAAVLSQDDRLTRFFANRPGCSFRKRHRVNNKTEPLTAQTAA